MSEAQSAPQRRNTWQREAVRGALAEAGGFVSAQSLHRQLDADDQRIGLATVYRALSALAEAGEADTLYNDDGEQVYRACGMAAHHHHLMCRRCGRTVEVRGEVVEKWAAEVARANGFTQVSHTVDLFGLCPECSARS